MLTKSSNNDDMILVIRGYHLLIMIQVMVNDIDIT